MRDVLTHLRKEYHWARHHVAAILLLVVIVPTMFTAGTVAFETAIPQDIPVAVAPAGEDVTDDDLSIVEGAVTVVTEPQQVDSAAEGERLLEREQVYAVLVVPPGIAEDTDEDVTVEFRVSGSVVPYKDASQALASVIELGLDSLIDRPVNVEYSQLPPESSLQEYLVPSGIGVLAILVGLGYLPRILADERDALPRVRVESSLSSLLAAKLIASVAIMLVPLAVILAVSAYLGYTVHPFTPAAIAAYVLLILHLESIGMTAVLLFEKRTAAVVNLAVAVALFAASNPFYPRGFFSPLRRDLAAHMPVHRAIIAIRGGMLREMSIWQLRWELGWILGAALLTLLVLFAAARYTTDNP